MRASPVACVLVIAASLFTGTAGADSTPIGPLPDGPTTTIVTDQGSLVAVALRRQRRSSGLVWRLARPVDRAVLRQVSEAEVGPSVVVVFRALDEGSAKLSFALTRGQTGTKAIRAATYTIRIR
jgi:hypothetical protein